MDKERIMLLSAIKQAQSNREFKSVFNLHVNSKSAKASTEARKKGNALYLQQTKHNVETHKAIFSHYCESIACAPFESQELALAYGNRSYFLLHIQKYEDSIKDIDQALKLTISDVLRAKLLCRKAECLKKLDSSSDTTSILETAQDLTEKIDGQDKVKLVEMIAAFKALNVNNTKKGETKKRMNNDKLPLTEDYSSYVSVEYNEKYGRHLVAAKDYKPGDIILIEKMYTSAAVQASCLFACDYCLKSVWSSIPCDHCDWLMYCSENCKEKAWNSYHDVECSLISHVKAVMPELWVNLSLHLRILITAIKETGNIAKLKKELESLDKCKNVPSKGLIKSGKFGINNIKNVYCLSFALSRELEIISIFIPLVLIGFAKYSILKDAFSDINKFEDLPENEDIMFLGSLFIKIIAISSSNAFGFPSDEFKNKKNSNLDGHMFSENIRMNNCHGLSILYSLFNHSCFPTADWRYTKQKQMLVFALQPIKKNSQIFINYGYVFEKEIKSDRQQMLSLKYNFLCDCQACVEEWPAIDIPGVVDKNAMEKDVLDDIKKGKYSMQDTAEIWDLIDKGQSVDKSHLKKLSLSITRGSQWKQPSLEFFVLTNIFRIISTSLYVPKSLAFKNCD